MPEPAAPIFPDRMPSKTPPPQNKTTRYALQQRAKALRPKVDAIRARIPWVFGDNAYIITAIAAAGGALRETDITACLGEAATRSTRQPSDDALGMIRQYRLRVQQGRGPRGNGFVFDDAFPLYEEAFALTRKIGKLHPLPVENNMSPEETLPPPPPRKYNLDLLAGTEVNTLVLATTRLLRRRVTRSELIAAVPHNSMTAVERAVQRQLEYGILDTGGGAGI
ncbi:MAG TPA: hypothetical protein VJP76_02930 [Candidatus Tumulicola sp.]|nr:hypothetical protein [Candidatus Tumulicola sp.]